MNGSRGYSGMPPRRRDRGVRLPVRIAQGKRATEVVRDGLSMLMLIGAKGARGVGGLVAPG